MRDASGPAQRSLPQAMRALAALVAAAAARDYEVLPRVVGGADLEALRAAYPRPGRNLSSRRRVWADSRGVRKGRVVFRRGHGTRQSRRYDAVADSTELDHSTHSAAAVVDACAKAAAAAHGDADESYSIFVQPAAPRAPAEPASFDRAATQTAFKMAPSFGARIAGTAARG